MYDIDNKVIVTHPHIHELILDKEVGYKYTYGSAFKTTFKCYCGNELYKSITSVVRKGLSCPKCKDGMSFGEKMMYLLLKDNNIEFEYDSKLIKSENKRYDFIIKKFSTIIEIHGEHHYIEKSGYFSSNRSINLQEEHDNDDYKKNIAIKYGILHYIPIKVKAMDLKSFKENVKKSNILNILDIKEVDFEALAMKGYKSIILEVGEYYNLYKKEKSTSVIAKDFNLTTSTIIKYLKICKNLNICDYTPNDKNTKIAYLKNRYVAVKQYSLDGIYLNQFESIKDACNHLGKPRSNSISGCCKGVLISAYGFIWRYADDVEIDVVKYRRKDNRSVVKLSLDNEFLKVYPSIKDAKEDTNCNNISKVCNGTYNQSSGFKWMYLEDYEIKYGKIKE